ncbi:MAG: ABC transporter ATP-binding protein [Christensenellaceae bacterium]|jgi:ABC-type lipoprotein export system ATPase subunit|nr:ABC transporter ATP-binding protein [Christensenellaceae bacterium]
MNIITLKNTTKKFGDRVILNNVTVEIPEGSFFSIVGNSGSGKSTLLNIMGLLDFGQSGEYFWENKLLKSNNKRQHAQIRNEQIGFVFQSYNLLDGYSVIENIKLPLLYGKRESKKCTRENEILERLDLTEIFNSDVVTLSGGEKQRVAIARALINSPKLIICDEATGNLDNDNALKVVEILNEENQKGTTIIFVTHSDKFNSYFSHRAKLEAGAIALC